MAPRRSQEWLAVASEWPTCARGRGAPRRQVAGGAPVRELLLPLRDAAPGAGLILGGILLFVASFAVSLGPVTWVFLSEIFPNAVRGAAIAVVAFVNGLVSFLVQLVFPWELATLGSATTFLIYGLFAAAGLVFVIMVVPETKGRSLEELEAELVRTPGTRSTTPGT